LFVHPRNLTIGQKTPLSHKTSMAAQPGKYEKCQEWSGRRSEDIRKIVSSAITPGREL
jgi:hypothetical protein